MLDNILNSRCNVIRSQSHRFLGLNPNVLHHAESSRLAFLLPVSSATMAILAKRYNRLIQTFVKWTPVQIRIMSCSAGLNSKHGNYATTCNKVYIPLRNIELALTGGEIYPSLYS